MAKNKIGIRNVTQVGVADIDVYGTKRKLLDNTIPKNAEKVKLNRTSVVNIMTSHNSGFKKWRGTGFIRNWKGN